MSLFLPMDIFIRLPFGRCIQKLHQIRIIETISPFAIPGDSLFTRRFLEFAETPN